MKMGNYQDCINRQKWYLDLLNIQSEIEAGTQFSYYFKIYEFLSQGRNIFMLIKVLGIYIPIRCIVRNYQERNTQENAQGSPGQPCAEMCRPVVQSKGKGRFLRVELSSCSSGLERHSTFLSLPTPSSLISTLQTTVNLSLLRPALAFPRLRSCSDVPVSVQKTATGALVKQPFRDQ